MFKSFAIAFAFLAVLRNSVTADISTESKMKMMFKMFLAGKNCLNKHPLSAEDIDSFKKLTFPDGDQAKCFSACLFRSTGFMDNNGYYTPEKALENASKAIDDNDPEELKQLEELFQSCSYVNNEDVGADEKACNRSKLVYICLKKKANELGFGLKL